MKILWISFYGSWTKPLLESLSTISDLKIGIIVPRKNGVFKKNIQNNISYYSVRYENNECKKRMKHSLANRYIEIIRDFSPDIIHVHGTENNHGQIQQFIKDVPVVVSIQGILTAYLSYTLNYLPIEEFVRFKSLKNYFHFGGLKANERIYKKGIKEYELDILQTNTYFIGRTLWDKAHVIMRNPNAKYYHGEELLRPVFYKNAGTWNVNLCQRHSIFMPAGFNPIKGLHLSIEAVSLLKRKYPDIQLYVPGISKDILYENILWRKIRGEEYLNYLNQRIKQKCLLENIHFLGRLDEDDMCKYMVQCNVFISPSSVDNSPNAVGEAMMIGTPIVTTPVGGVISILNNEENALFAPAGDSYVLAYQIERIFEDDTLSQKLGYNAYQKALKRNDINETTQKYIEIYKSVISDFRKSR
jgi:glycosyltransferase involved in cell wall biosynthesis